MTPMINMLLSAAKTNSTAIYKYCDIFFEKNMFQYYNMDVAIEHSVTGNPLNDLYFSKLNIDAVQEAVRYTIFKETGKVIDKQNERELVVIMRSIYLQYSRNLSTNLVKQVKELNKRVLDEIIPKIIMEMNQYQTYLRDASGLPIPMERGENTSTTGTKFLFNQDF